MGKITLKMPKAAVSMQEGVLSEWLAEDGTLVTLGQPVFAIETDKSTLEIECPFAGKLTHIARIGETYRVGEPIAIIVQ